MSKWFRLLTLILLVGFGKAHHVLRLVILAGLGLAGLWMLQTLAQEFNKIFNFQQSPTAPVPKYFAKRSINNASYSITEQHAETSPYPDIDWNRIVSRDPVGCARSFICQLVATNANELAVEESIILQLIRSSTQKENWSNKPILDALKYGQQVSNPVQCRKRYKFCPYSSKMMTSLLRLIGGT